MSEELSSGGVQYVHLRDGRTMKLRVRDLSEEVDVDKCLMIDVNNIYAELATSPVLLNKFGVLLADANKTLSEKKLDFDIFVSKRKESIRKELVSNGTKPTNEIVENALLSEPIYRLKKMNFVEAEKEVAIVNSVYWSLKDKNEKLNKMALSVQYGDMADGILNARIKTINHVSISMLKNVNKGNVED